MRLEDRAKPGAHSAPVNIHDERPLVDFLAAAVRSDVMSHAQADLLEDRAFVACRVGDVNDLGLFAVDANNAELGRRAELVAAGQRVVDVAQIPADAGLQIAVVEVPLAASEAARAGRAGDEGVLADDVAPGAVSQLQLDLLLGLRREWVAHRVADGGYAAALADGICGQSHRRAIDGKLDRALVDLRRLFRGGKLEFGSGGHVEVAGRGLGGAQIGRVLYPCLELAIDFDVTSRGAVVEKDACATGIDRPELEVSATATLRPNDTERINAILIYQHRGCSRADRDVDELGAGDIPRMGPDAQARIVVADQTQGVNALLEVQITGDLHRDVVSVAHATRDAGDQFIEVAFGAVEETRFGAFLLHVDEFPVKRAVGVGRR